MASLLRSGRPYAPLSTDDPSASSRGAVTVGLPPAWVDVSEEISADMQRARTKMAELAKAHAKALMPSFGDGRDDQRAIEVLTHEVTDLLKRSEKRLQKLSMKDSSEDSNVRKNVQRSLATDLQNLSMEFRKKQSSYLKQLRQQKQGQDGVDLEMNINGTKSTFEDDEFDDVGFTEVQMSKLKKSEAFTREREREIEQVVESVNELAQIMNPLSRAGVSLLPKSLSPHPLARYYCSRRSGADAMPSRKKWRVPPAKSQRQTEPDPQVPPGVDAPLEERLIWVSQQESERRITAIKAIKDAEAGNIPYQLQLVRSYYSKEQLEGNAMQYFQESLPNLLAVPNEEYDVLELKWKNGDEWMIGDFADDRTLRASIASFTTADGLQFARDSVGKDFYRRISNFSEFAWSEQPEGQMAGAAEAFQTPGAVSNQLSCGMTPKTVRLPKIGEMLLSVHGSPLGVYKEENLAAIEESGNGNEDAPC